MTKQGHGQEFTTKKPASGKGNPLAQVEDLSDAVPETTDVVDAVDRALAKARKIVAKLPPPVKKSEGRCGLC